MLLGIHAESIINRVEDVMQTENLVRKAILDGVHPKKPTSVIENFNYPIFDLTDFPKLRFLT